MPVFRNRIFTFLLVLCGLGCKKDDPGEAVAFTLEAIYVGNQQLPVSNQVVEIPIDLPLELVFSATVDPATVEIGISLLKEGAPVAVNLTASGTNVRLSPQLRLDYHTTYTLVISGDLKSRNGASFTADQYLFRTQTGTIQLEGFTIDGQAISPFTYLQGISLQPTIQLQFSSPLDTTSLPAQISLIGGNAPQPQFSYSTDLLEATIRYTSPLEDLKRYHFLLRPGVKGLSGAELEPFGQTFYTTVDTLPKFPLLSDEELLTLVQRQTFKYFWDFGHPVSGLARERNTSGDLVTSGGSGFGLMAIVVGMERGFVSKEEALTRLKTIVDFLEQKSERFNGAWPHWLNGVTGKTIPFSPNDDGADLVETSYLAMGLLTVRQYLDDSDPAQAAMIDQINQLWAGINWQWHTRNGQQVLYWHWSPNFGWEKNQKISGYNEALITYILAAASPNYPVDASVYHEGWARKGDIKNGKTFYELILPLGNEDYGGPLFFEQYTFLGIDPRNLKDAYADYWQQTVNHTLINRAYCVDNPKNFVGYGPGCWGLTASDSHNGYAAHSPTNDLGVITPTAALSSFPYSPEYSMEALHHFYYLLGDRLWKEYGFVDAFNFTEAWVADSFLAIDQGPIILMIENYRSGLLWALFMSCPEVQDGLTRLGFTY